MTKTKAQPVQRMRSVQDRAVEVGVVEKTLLREIERGALRGPQDRPAVADRGRGLGGVPAPTAAGVVPSAYVPLWQVVAGALLEQSLLLHQQPKATVLTFVRIRLALSRSVPY